MLFDLIPYLVMAVFLIVAVSSIRARKNVDTHKAPKVYHGRQKQIRLPKMDTFENLLNELTFRRDVYEEEQPISQGLSEADDGLRQIEPQTITGDHSFRPEEEYSRLQMESKEAIQALEELKKHRKKKKQHEKVLAAQRKREDSHKKHYISMLHDPEKMRDIFVASEIFRRKDNF